MSTARLPHNGGSAICISRCGTRAEPRRYGNHQPQRHRYGNPASARTVTACFLLVESADNHSEQRHNRGDTDSADHRYEHGHNRRMIITINNTINTIPATIATSVRLTAPPLVSS